MADWLTETDIILEDWKRQIAKTALNEAPNIRRVPVNKAEQVVDILARKFAEDDWNESDKRLLDDVFSLAFYQD
jgi:hypothetical protein